MLKKLKKYWGESDDGVTTVEVILVLVVLIALVVIFREQIMGLIDGIFDNMKSTINTLY